MLITMLRRCTIASLSREEASRAIPPDRGGLMIARLGLGPFKRRAALTGRIGRLEQSNRGPDPQVGEVLPGDRVDRGLNAG